MNTQALVISDVLIHEEETGHYSLNDFHQAAGGESKHQPSNFLRLESTKALIEEIDRSSDLRNAIIVKQGGTNQGTFAVKEIIYAYAMWISPAFHLKVIRAFDAMVTGQLTSHGAAYIEELKSHLESQKLLTAAQQDQIAYIRDKAERLVASLQNQLKVAQMREDSLRISKERSQEEVKRAVRAQRPIGDAEKAEMAEHYQRGWTISMLTFHFFRSPSIIRRTLREMEVFNG